MARIVASEMVSVDGVMEDPGGAEGSAHGGWAFTFNRGPEGDKFKLDETLEADALLLGRVTYEGFAAVWPTVEDEVGFAEKMNKMPKYVVSGTLTETAWNATLVGADAAAAATRLKRDVDGTLLVAGSATLAQALAAAGLVDEFRLMVYPIVLGGGKRLFGDGPPVPLKLASSRAVGEGVLISTYEPA